MPFPLTMATGRVRFQRADRRRIGEEIEARGRTNSQPLRRGRLLPGVRQMEAASQTMTLPKLMALHCFCCLTCGFGCKESNESNTQASIAFLSDEMLAEDGGKGFQGFTMTADGGNRKRTSATDRQIGYLTISPSGKRLAYRAYDPEFGSRKGWGIWLVGPEFDKPFRMKVDGDCLEPAFSPDEKTLVFSSNFDGNFDVYSIPFAGGPRRRLTATPDAVEALPSFSYDGSMICFVRADDSGTQIWTLTIGTGEERMVTSDDAAKAFPRFCPDGRKIVYSSRGPNQNEIREVTLATGKTSTIAADSSDNDCPSYLDDRHVVFHSNRTGKYQIYILDIGKNELRRLPSDANDRLPVVAWRSRASE